jgi:tetratricopeptide (TPR) repeat protein
MYGVMGNHKVAAQEYKSELDNNTNSVPTMIALGRELLELNDPKGASVYLTQAMKLAPQNADAKFYSANANRGLKNYQGAIALYQEAIRLDQGNPTIYKKMGECFVEMGDTISARAAFKKYLEMEPDAQDRKEFEQYL